MRKLLRYGGLGILLAGLCLLGARSALANVAPTDNLWFTFADVKPAAPRSLQVLACDDEACAAPLLVYQYGVCDAAECSPGPLAPQSHASLKCVADICLLHIDYVEMGLPFFGHFKLVAQYADQTRVSAVALWPLTGWNGFSAFTVQVQGADLILLEDPDFVAPAYDFPYDFSRGMILTLLVEIVVAGAGFWLLKITDLTDLLGRLTMLGLINVLSYPLAWIVFPAWAQIQYYEMFRTFALHVPLAILAYGGMLAWIYLPKTPKVGWIAGLPEILLVSTIILLLAMASMKVQPPVPALPYPIVLLIEAFVVVFEAALLFVLSRRTIPWTHAAIISLVMNLASYLAGLAVF